jgi:methyl-accepting chemotaxis protein
LPSTRVIGEVSLAQDGFRRQQLQHAIADGAAEMAAIEKDLAGFDAAVREGLKSYEPYVSDAEDRKLLDTATSQWTAYVKATKPAIAASHANDNALTMEILNGQGRAKFDAAQRTMETWTALNETGARESMKAGEQAASRAGRTLLILGFIAAAVAVGVALVLARRIVRAITSVLDAARGIAEGDLDQQIEVRSQDEVGQMADQFRDLVAYLDEIATHATASRRAT